MRAGQSPAVCLRGASRKPNVAEKVRPAASGRQAEPPLPPSGLTLPTPRRRSHAYPLATLRSGIVARAWLLGEAGPCTTSTWQRRWCHSIPQAVQGSQLRSTVAGASRATWVRSTAGRHPLHNAAMPGGARRTTRPVVRTRRQAIRALLKRTGSVSRPTRFVLEGRDLVQHRPVAIVRPTRDCHRASPAREKNLAPRP